MKKTKVLVSIGLLVAMDIILTRFLAFQIDTLRVSFGFVPVSFSSILFGPLIGGLGAVLGDILGMVVAPKGAYFPGFTVSAFLTAVVYGIFLFRKPKTLIRVTLAVLFITVFIDIGLNTYWLTILLGKGYMAMLPARVIKSAMMIPVQISTIYLLWRYAGKRIENILAGRIGHIAH